MAAPFMQDLNELYAELTRDILDQVRDIEAGVAQPHLVFDKLEQFIEIIGVISALSTHYLLSICLDLLCGVANQKSGSVNKLYRSRPLSLMAGFDSLNYFMTIALAQKAWNK